MRTGVASSSRSTNPGTASARSGTSPTSCTGGRSRPTRSPRRSVGASSHRLSSGSTAPFGPGSLQLFVDVDYAQHYFTLLENGQCEAALETVCAFDVVANNADRKSGHVLLGSEGRIWAIDHGLCFHHLHKLRTVIWDFAGCQIPGRLRDDLAQAEATLPDALTGLLDEEEIDAAVARVTSLLRAGVFPEPKGDRPPYPWPLV